MYSSVIGKIEKAKRYAEEKGRVTFSSFVVTFRGRETTTTRWNTAMAT